MIVRAIDGRFLGHPFFSPSKKKRHGNGCRQRPLIQTVRILSIYNVEFTSTPVRCRAPVLSVSGPAALSLSVSGSSALCRAPSLLCQGQSLCRARRSLCRGPALSVSGPGALCVRARRSPALCVSGPDTLSLSVSGSVSGPRSPATVCVGPRRFSVSGPGALCVGALRSLCRAPALSVSGPALCVGARRSRHCLCRGPALSRSPGSGPGALAPLSVEPGTLCVGPRCFSVSAPALSVSGPCALCVGPGTLLLSVSASLSVSGPVGARRSPALSVSGPGTLSLSVSGSVSGPRSPALSVSGAALSVSGPGAVWPRSSLCRGTALSVSGPGTLSLSVSGSVSTPALSRHSLCRGPALLCVGPRHSLALCVGPRRSPGAPCVGPLCRRRSLFWKVRRSLCRAPALSASEPSQPSQLRSACHACHPSSPSRSVFPGENRKPYCLGKNIVSITPCGHSIVKIKRRPKETTEDQRPRAHPRRGRRGEACLRRAAGHAGRFFCSPEMWSVSTAVSLPKSSNSPSLRSVA